MTELKRRPIVWTDPPAGAPERRLGALGALDVALVEALRCEAPAALTEALRARTLAAAGALRPVPFWSDPSFGTLAAAVLMALLIWLAALVDLAGTLRFGDLGLMEALRLVLAQPLAVLTGRWVETLAQQGALLAVACAAWLILSRLLPEPGPEPQPESG